MNLFLCLLVTQSVVSRSELPLSFCSGHRNSFVWPDVERWEEYAARCAQRGVNQNMSYCRWRRSWASQCRHSVHRDVSLSWIWSVCSYPTNSWFLSCCWGMQQLHLFSLSKRWFCVSFLSSECFSSNATDFSTSSDGLEFMETLHLPQKLASRKR